EQSLHGTQPRERALAASQTGPGPEGPGPVGGPARIVLSDQKPGGCTQSCGVKLAVLPFTRMLPAVQPSPTSRSTLTVLDPKREKPRLFALIVGLTEPST